MYAFELNDLVRYYGKNKVLDGLCIKVPKGKIYGFLGRNGAGKTTTIRIILGLIRHHGGHIAVNGQELSRSSVPALRHIGSIVEFPNFYPNLDGFENLRVFQLLYGTDDAEAIRHALNTVGLSDAGRKKTGSYSLGMKQRLGLARALLNDPDILVLDEPTNGLDPSGIRDMRKMLKSLSTEHGKTIFFSSHILSEIEQIVDMVGIIKDGKTEEEIEIEKLREKCADGLNMKVSNPDRAALLLKQSMNMDCTYDAEEDIVIIRQNVDAGMVNKFLNDRGFVVSMLKKSSQSLEEYFLNITA